MDNPWNIKSIYDLQCFSCPSCDFKNDSKQEIITHAYQKHPESIEFLSNIRDNSLSDVTCPWNESETKLENPDCSNAYEVIMGMVTWMCQFISLRGLYFTALLCCSAKSEIRVESGAKSSCSRE